MSQNPPPQKPEQSECLCGPGAVCNLPNHEEKLPEGFTWEYRCGYDGAGSYSEQRSMVRTSTMYRRAVGPWKVHPDPYTIVMRK